MIPGQGSERDDGALEETLSGGASFRRKNSRRRKRSRARVSSPLSKDRVINGLCPQSCHAHFSVQVVFFAPVRGLVVEIHHPNDPTQTSILVKEQPRHNEYTEVIEVKLDGKNGIVVNMIKDTTALGRPVPLSLRFTYHPEAGYAPIREVMDGRNDRIKEFYWRAWFGDEEFNLDSAVTGKFDGGVTTISSQDINDFVHAVGNTGEAFVDRPGKTVYAPMDFAIVVGWKAITKPIFPRKIDGDLLKLVHLSNGFRMMPGAEPLKKGDTVQTTAQVNAIINQQDKVLSI